MSNLLRFLFFFNEMRLEPPEMTRKMIQNVCLIPRLVRGKNSTVVDGGLSKGSTVHSLWSENPHWCQQNIWPEQRDYFSSFLGA